MAVHFKKSASARQRAGKELQPWDNLFLQKPQSYAASEAAAGRYAIYSIAMGYGAEEKDAQIFGVDCAGQVETVPLVFGCVPPGSVFFKRVFDYNAAMLAQPDFPHAAACKVNEKFTADALKWFSQEIESANKERAENIEKWRKAEKRSYNP